MTSIIRRLKDRLYPSQGYTVTILGLSNSGKTTLLYYLKSGEIVQTIPSIGFNVETVEVTTSSKKIFKMTGWDVGTGCGITYLYGILQMYIASSDALIWVVDSSDREYLSESIDALQRIVSDLHSSDKKAPDRLPILILANKSDKPGSMSLDEIRVAFSKVVAGKLSAVYQTACNAENPITQSGFPTAFDWLSLAVDISKSSKPLESAQKELAPAPLDPRSQTTIMQKLDDWLTRAQSDIGADEFIARFQSFDLPSWDHYTHIRIAYTLLAKYGRQEGKDLIFKGLEAYIAASPQTKGKSFHVTMTYFWIQIVHFGIRNMPASPESTGPIAAAAVTSELRLASPEDFARFLLINPHVADGNLWSDYYTKEVIMTPTAKAGMVLPDKKALPNLVIRDAITISAGKASK